MTTEQLSEPRSAWRLTREELRAALLGALALGEAGCVEMCERLTGPPWGIDACRVLVFWSLRCLPGAVCRRTDTGYRLFRLEVSEHA